MRVTTALVMMRTKNESGQTARQCAITQRARALTRPMRQSSTASTALLMNAAGVSAVLSPAAATAAAGAHSFSAPAATAAVGASATLSPAAETTAWNAGGLCASTSSLDSGMTTGPNCDFGETALRAVATMNGLSSPVTASSLSKPLWSVAECVTEGGAVDDSADILAACDGTISPEGLRVSTSVLESGVVTKTSFDLEGLRFRKSPP